MTKENPERKQEPPKLLSSLQVTPLYLSVIWVRLCPEPVFIPQGYEAIEGTFCKLL